MYKHEDLKSITEDDKTEDEPVHAVDENVGERENEDYDLQTPSSWTFVNIKQNLCNRDWSKNNQKKIQNVHILYRD